MEEVLIGLGILIPIVIYIIVMIYGIKKENNKLIIRNTIILDIIFFIIYKALKFKATRNYYENYDSSSSTNSFPLALLTICFYLVILGGLIITIISIFINFFKNKKKIKRN